jgi:hypothetical protein
VTLGYPSSKPCDHHSWKLATSWLSSPKFTNRILSRVLSTNQPMTAKLKHDFSKVSGCRGPCRFHLTLAGIHRPPPPWLNLFPLPMHLVNENHWKSFPSDLGPLEGHLLTKRGSLRRGESPSSLGRSVDSKFLERGRVHPTSIRQFLLSRLVVSQPLILSCSQKCLYNGTLNTKSLQQSFMTWSPPISLISHVLRAI